MENETNLVNKKTKRLQNRKRKLEFFFEIALLNDTQREANKRRKEEGESSKKKKKKKGKSSKRGCDIYKKEIANMLAASKKTMLDAKKKDSLSDTDYKALKQALRQRKQILKSQPRFWVRENGLKASLDVEPELRMPLFFGDVQHLVLFALMGNKIHQEHNRWCHLQRHGLVRHVTVLILEGVGAGDLLTPLKKMSNKKTTEDKCEEGRCINQLYTHAAVELVNPETYDRSLADDFCLVPLSASMCRKMLLKFGSKESELKSKLFRAAFPVTLKDRECILEDEKQENKVIVSESDVKNVDTKPKVELELLPRYNGMLLHPADKFPRTELLMSPSQMIEEGYIVPIGEMAYRYQHFAYTKDHYAAVTPLSPMFGLDCEMCLTTSRVNELTRISIVNEKHEAIYETLVMPPRKIINYLTQYSGITPQMLRGVKTTLKDVQRDIKALLPPDAILVGQSLNGDLRALEMFHPYVIDSSVVFNIWGQRKRKTKLKTLTEMFLGEKIQQGHSGHDSIEDSIAALKLVQFKLSKYIEFGDTVLGFNMDHIKNENAGEKIALERKRQQIIEEEEKLEKEEGDYKHTPQMLPQPEILKMMEASSLFKLVARTSKVGVFGTPEILKQYAKYISGPHEMSGTSLQYRAGSHALEAVSNYKVVKKLMAEGSIFDLAVAHLKYDMKDAKERARAINSCLLVGESVIENGMVIVIAGGRPLCDSDGRPEHRPACFVHLNIPKHTKL